MRILRNYGILNCYVQENAEQAAYIIQIEAF